MIGEVDSESFNTEGSMFINAKMINDDEFDEANNDLKHDDFRHYYYGEFPWIKDIATFGEYKLHERAYYDIYQCIIPNSILIVKILHDLLNMTDRASFLLASFIIFFSLSLYILFIWMKCNKNAIQNSDSYFAQAARRFQLTWVGQNMENILTVCGTIIHGCILYVRVFNGECRSSSPWESQVGYQINLLLLYFE
jgi:hypothetical protein